MNHKVSDDYLQLVQKFKQNHRRNKLQMRENIKKKKDSKVHGPTKIAIWLILFSIVNVK